MRFSYTIQRHQEAGSGPTAGFDYMRIALALSVLFWHTVGTCAGLGVADRVMETFWHVPIRLIIPMFFSLSGFLVASSLDRSNTLLEFLYLRALRIVPALSVESLLSALLLGPMLTTLSLGSYFHDKQFFSYLLNIVGLIHYGLPGLFANNPIPKIVNAQLWTVPFELDCYKALSVLAILGIARRRKLFLAAVFVAIIAEYLLIGVHHGAAVSHAVPGKTLVLYFLVGALIHRWRDVVPYNLVFCVLCLVIGGAMMELGGPLLYLSTLPVAYVTVFVGLTRPKKIPFILSGDYSYGVYLYAFPIQQTVAATVSTDWRVQMPVALVLTCLFAMISWHFVEKPLLRCKKLMSKVRLPIPSFAGGVLDKAAERAVRRAAGN